MGWQRSGNFGCDRPILGKMGAGWDESSGARVFLCVVIHTTFRNFTKFWSRNVLRCPVDESGKTFSKIFTLGIICPQNLKSNVGQTGTSLMGCTAEILFTPRYSPRAMKFLRSVNFSLQRTVAELWGLKVANFWILAYFPHRKPLKRTLRWPAYSPDKWGHGRMITIFPCGSRRSKGVPSSSAVFLQLMVGELGTRNLPKVLPMANGYTHTEFYYTARQIWTKDIWKCAVLMTDVLSY